MIRLKQLRSLRLRSPFYLLQFLGEPVVIEPVSSSPGRVVKATPSVYEAEVRTDGGRVVRVMPRQLRKIKEAQEKRVEDV